MVEPPKLKCYSRVESAPFSSIRCRNHINVADVAPPQRRLRPPRLLRTPLRLEAQLTAPADAVRLLPAPPFLTFRWWDMSPSGCARAISSARCSSTSRRSASPSTASGDAGATVESSSSSAAACSRLRALHRIVVREAQEAARLAVRARDSRPAEKGDHHLHPQLLSSPGLRYRTRAEVRQA